MQGAVQCSRLHVLPMALCLLWSAEVCFQAINAHRQESAAPLWPSQQQWQLWSKRIAKKAQNTLTRLTLILTNENCTVSAFVLWENEDLRHTEATYLITPTCIINHFLQALNVCDSVTNQQIDTPEMLVLSIMQQHLSAEAAHCFSASRYSDNIYCAHGPLLSPNNSSDFHRWSVRQSDRAAKGIGVSYRSGTDPACVHVCWHRTTRQTVNVRTQVCP